MEARLVPSEDDDLIALVAWCRWHTDERRMAYHIPNEGRRTRFGHARQVAKGLIPGAADLFIPGLRGGWGGLYLELKAWGKQPTQAQTAFGIEMNACGYAWAWADNGDAARRLIDEYMAGKLTRPNWVHYSAPAKAP